MPIEKIGIQNRDLIPALHWIAMGLSYIWGLFQISGSSNTKFLNYNFLITNCGNQMQKCLWKYIEKTNSELTVNCLLKVKLPQVGLGSRGVGRQETLLMSPRPSCSAPAHSLVSEAQLVVYEIHQHHSHTNPSVIKSAGLGFCHSQLKGT